MARQKVVKLQERPFIVGSNDEAQVEWAKYTQVGNFVSQSDVNSLRIVEGQSEEAVAEILAEKDNGLEFGKAAKLVFETIKDPLPLAYTLQLVETALLPNLPEIAPVIFGTKKKMSADLLSGEVTAPEDSVAIDLGPMVQLVNHSDLYVRARALYICALLISVSQDIPDQESGRKFVLGALLDELSDRKNPLLTIEGSLQSLSVMLRSSSVRRLFVQREGISLLMDLIARSFSSLGGDSQYHAVLCLWLACFEESAARRIQQVDLTTLVTVLRSEPRNRVVRVCLSTMRIVLSNENTQRELCESLIELKLPRLLSQLKQKKATSDVELVEDIEWLDETLSKNFKVLTTFARHEQELLTHKLHWSMIHEEIFWKENALRFQQNNFSSVQRLIDLIRSSEDPDTLAVACSDIGFFVQYYPNGKLIVEKYGGKQEIMKLLSHEVAEVQKKALTACSKIMVTNWDTFKANS